MQRLIQDTIRKALADELLFGRLVNGGRVHIAMDPADPDKVQLEFPAEDDAGAKPQAEKRKDNPELVE
jgi:ATP-dependent Clp protease ATP-binding subunit ClpA